MDGWPDLSPHVKIRILIFLILLFDLREREQENLCHLEIEKVVGL